MSSKATNAKESFLCYRAIFLSPGILTQGQEQDCEVPTAELGRVHRDVSVDVVFEDGVFHRPHRVKHLRTPFNRPQDIRGQFCAF